MLRSGYSANAEIILAEAKQVVTVPESTIEFSGDSTFVYVLTDSTGKDKTYTRRPVVTGLSDGVSIEIKKGAATNEKLRGPQIITDDNNNE
jgi:HlyD family secretion protein